MSTRVPNYMARVFYDGDFKLNYITYDKAAYRYEGAGGSTGTSGWQNVNVGTASFPNHILVTDRYALASSFSLSNCIRSRHRLPIGGDLTDYDNKLYIGGPFSHYLFAKLNGITIVFPTNRYATKIRLTITLHDSSTITVLYTGNTKHIFSVNFADIDEDLPFTILLRVAIDIVAWSSAGNYIYIVAILPYFVKDYVRDNGLEKYTRGCQSTADNTFPSYEPVAQYGELVLRDRDLHIAKLAATGLFKSRKKVKLFLDNRVIGTYVSEKWNYDNDEKIVRISLTDKLMDAQQNKYIVNLVYGVRKVLKSRTVSSILTSIGMLLKARYDMYFYFAGIPDNLYNMTISDFYCKDQTDWEFLTKLCQLLGCQIYKTGDEYNSSTECKEYSVLRRYY